jgi:hypothetical protein
MTTTELLDKIARGIEPEDPLNPELGPEHREYWIRKVERRRRSRPPGAGGNQ